MTGTLAAELIRGIDRREKNRSKFVTEAVGHEHSELQVRSSLRHSADPVCTVT